jgi:hypothetical protein
MVQFRASNWSHKNGACQRLAEQIAHAAEAMGLRARIDASRLSASRYVVVTKAGDEDEDSDYERLKIRCSDHEDRYGGSDWQVWAGACPSGTIVRMAAHFSRPVPTGYRKEDYEARSLAAQKAQKSRQAIRKAAENEILAQLVDRLRDERLTSKIVAGRILDGIAPGIPKAMRARLATTASHLVTTDRQIRDAVDNHRIEDLVRLAIINRAAQSVLLELVGEEQYLSLRPSGFPRSMWSDVLVKDPSTADRSDSVHPANLF